MATVKFRCPLCRRTISASIEAAGKRGRCPGCKKSISIPKTAEESSNATGNSVGLTIDGPTPDPSIRFSPKAVRPSDVFDATGTDDDEYKLVEPANRACSSCGRPLEAQAIFCVACGLDLRTGKKLQTARALEGDLARRCSVCGAELASDQKSCPHCGEAGELLAASAIPAEKASKETKQAESTSSTMKARDTAHGVDKPGVTKVDGDPVALYLSHFIYVFIFGSSLSLISCGMEGLLCGTANKDGFGLFWTTALPVFSQDYNKTLPSGIAATRENLRVFFTPRALGMLFMANLIVSAIWPLRPLIRAYDHVSIKSVPGLRRLNIARVVKIGTATSLMASVLVPTTIVGLALSPIKDHSATKVIGVGLAVIWLMSFTFLCIRFIAWVVDKARSSND